MVRDRLAELQSKVTDRFEDVELGSTASSAHSDQFHSKMTQVRSLLDDLRDDIFELKRRQDHVLSLPVVSIQHKTELQGYIDRIRQKTRTLQPTIQSIEQELRQFENATKSATEVRMRKNQFDLVRKKMRDVIDQFNEQQIEYKERVSKRVKRSLDLAGETLSEPEVDRMLNSNTQQIFFREVNPLSIAGRMALEDASARHEEIVELEESLRLLQEMFEDMYNLVNVQGEMVNRIETNVDDAVVHVNEAKKQTKQAVEYKKSALRKKWCLIISLIVILLILIAVAIVLAVVLSGKSK